MRNSHAGKIKFNGAERAQHRRFIDVTQVTEPENALLLISKSDSKGNSEFIVHQMAKALSFKSLR
ncbi:hypothetical protein [Hyphomicrobium sp. 2TAF46]|uniref:hypothetical protein n=1 Tax=Hyphomicrobium sp. 2TAF46 TaxID=3233019 RepID=UPI003F8FEB16